MNNNPSHHYGRSIAMPIPPSLNIEDPRLPMSRTLEPATHPNLPSLALISPLLPWAIMVHVSAINPVFVTVADILCMIYRGGIRGIVPCSTCAGRNAPCSGIPFLWDVPEGPDMTRPFWRQDSQDCPRVRWGDVVIEDGGRDRSK